MSVQVSKVRPHVGRQPSGNRICYAEAMQPLSKIPFLTARQSATDPLVHYRTEQIAVLVNLAALPPQQRLMMGGTRRRSHALQRSVRTGFSILHQWLLGPIRIAARLRDKKPSSRRLQNSGKAAVNEGLAATLGASSPID